MNGDFARAALAGLSRPKKELPSEYFYDDLGSALFEAITRLPEYGVTRADDRVLAALAPELPARLAPRVVVELGSGNGRKARPILETLRPALYCPIDVSQAALDRCITDLGELVDVRPVCRPYLEGLHEVTSSRTGSAPLLVLFAGSNIGNFSPAQRGEFLRSVRALLAPGDALLLGCDLVKPLGAMLLAYDDPAGVTAAFNLNLLGRMNRELGADFVLRQFRHEARFDDEHDRIEMHLRSRRPQVVTVAGHRFAFEEGETIWTESSHKFRRETIPNLAANAGFACERQWIDEEWPFSESLWIASL